MITGNVEILKGMTIKKFFDDCEEFENFNFLKYYIECSKWLLKKLKFYSNSKLEYNEVVKIHFLSDTLLSYIGRISDRFLVTNKRKLKSIVELNDKRYGFDNNKYQILSSRKVRNAMIHIFENNFFAIQNNKNISLFNVININTDKDLIERYDNGNCYFAYTVDFRNYTIVLRKDDKKEIIYMNELEKELNNLNNDLIK